MHESAKCPLCGSANTKAVDWLETELLIWKWRELYRIDVRPEFHGRQKIVLHRCGDCLLEFFLPLCVCGSAKLYDALDFFDWYYPQRRWEHEQALSELQGTQTALEIGCGPGEFMYWVREETGIAMEGLEQNPEAIDLAAKRGFRVRNGKIEELVSEAEKYDVVCSFQVLEHVPEPGNFLRACCDVLRPGGRLILGLPNAQSFLRLQFNLLDMPPHHMSRWRTETLDRVAEIFPLRLRRIALEPLESGHVDEYVEAHSRVLGDGSIAQRFGPVMKRVAAKTLRGSGLHKFLRGQGLYVSYERV